MRRLVVCFDGTWNTPDAGAEPTNVVKLLRAVPSRAPDAAQIVFYDKGVGTGGPLDRVVGGASGVGLSANVIDGYRFLGNNYAPGDEIYVFGFSRGAYTARSLAGLIGLVGLCRPTHLGGPLGEALRIYRDHGLGKAGKRAAIDALGLERHAGVRIRCVGVWDTVGALGIPGDLGRRFYLKPYRFHDVELGARVDVALHAVAIDEKRGAFSPTLWVSSDGKPRREGQIVEQVWFPGVHSNVGGSYPCTGLADTALDWMAKRVAKHTGLVLDGELLARTCRPRVDGIGYESRSALYLTSRLYAYQRLINQTLPRGRGFGEWFRGTFEQWDRRNRVPSGSCTVNEMLHVAALERWSLPGVLHDAADGRGTKRPYRPANLEAVIRARSVPVVDWAGEVMAPDAAWPRRAERRRAESPAPVDVAVP